MDETRKWTDRQLANMEGRIKRVYSQAEKELTEKWENWSKKQTGKMLDLHTAMLSAPIGSPQYDVAKKNYTEYMQKMQLTDMGYKKMIDSVAMDISKVNQTAVAYMNGQMPSIYVHNFNAAAKDAKVLGIDFSLRDEHTIHHLIWNNTVYLPKKKVSIPKDLQWNRKQLNSAVLQGVLQGESMRDIAKRVSGVIGNNEVAAMRNARTMVTQAENKGRLDSYKDLTEQGAVIKKVWIATADGRTREWHLSMDGQEVHVEDYFLDGDGNELEYPGDPDAPPETVYNCRCSMGSHIIGFRRKNGTIHQVKNVQYKPEALHSQQIQEERKRRQEQGTSKLKNKIPAEFNRDAWMESLRGNDLDNIRATMFEEWNNKITSRERDAIWKYTGDAYKTMNPYLRNNTKDGSSYYWELIRDTQSGLGKSSVPETFIVSRGTGTGSASKLLGMAEGELRRSVRGGQVLDNLGILCKDEGFLSTSPDPHGGFNKTVEWIIQVPKGTKGAYIGPISEFGHEEEFLINSGSTMLVHRIEGLQFENADIRIFASLLGTD